jgi:hypothetical protein
MKTSSGVDGLTPELADAIFLAASRGMRLPKAARSCGVSTFKWSRWRRFAEEGRAPFAEFMAEGQRREASLIDRALQVVERSLDSEIPDAKLACWLMERLAPETYSVNVRATLKSTLMGLTNALRSEFRDQPEIMQRILTAMRRAQDADSEDIESTSAAATIPEVDEDSAATH